MSKITKRTKSAFFDILKESNVEGFLDFSSKHKSKKLNFSFEDLLKSLSKAELVEIWEKLFDFVETYTAVVLEVEDGPVNNKAVDAATGVLQTAVDLGNLTFEQLSCVPAGLLQMTIFLHGVLLRFSDDKDSLKNSISHLCEKFWIGDLDGKEHLATNTMIYLLRRTLRVKGTKSDVKRVWVLRNALSAMQTAEEFDSDELLKIMELCVTSTLYLSSLEGQKLICFMIGLDEKYIEKLHDAIKGQLPSCSLKQSEMYGKIYYNAWMKSVKENSLPIKEKLEMSCIQDLMYYAVHVQRNCPRSLVPILRKFLAYFHLQKKEIAVSKMLRNLYEPILWRSLKDPNGNVRANASQLFFDVFPLEDPDLNIAETELELQRQLIIIKDLLVDDFPVIRSIAAIGVCIVLHLNWELVSHEMIKVYFKILVDDLACDSSSADVRYAVIKGLKVLLENHLSMPTLKVILPKLQGLFHDVSEKVRFAFCHLLLDVKNVCSIKYWHIVPVEHLLARMEEDKPSIAKLIVQLIYNSYIPDTEPEDFWLSRCIELIKLDREASRVFFQHVHHFISLEATVKYMILSCRTLHLFVKSRVQPEALLHISDEKENVSSNASSLISSFGADGSLGFDNPNVVAGVIDAVAILWIGVQNQLQKPENKKMYKQILGKFSVYMPVLLKHFKNNEIWSSVFYICGFLPSSFIPEFSNVCLLRLKELAPESQPQDYSTLLTCLCNQNKSEEVLELIKDWLQHGLDQHVPKPITKKRKSKGKAAESQENIAPKPYLAIKFLEELLNTAICRAAMLRNNSLILKNMIEDIGTVQNLIKNAKGTSVEDEQSMFLFKTFSVFVKIAVLLQGENVLNADVSIRKLMNWTRKNLLVSSKADDKNKKGRKSRSSRVIEMNTYTSSTLSVAICKELLNLSSDMVQIGFVDSKFSDYTAFAHEVINSECGHLFVPQVARLIYQISEYSKCLSEKEELQQETQKLIPEAFSDIVQFLKIEDIIKKISEADKAEMKIIMREILISQNRVLPSPISINSMITNLFDATVEELVPVIEKLALEPCDKIELPFISVTLISIISGSVELLLLYMKIICSWMADKDLPHCLASCVILTRAVQDNKNIHRKSVSYVKDTIVTFEKLFNSFDQENKLLLDHAKKEIITLKRQVKNEICLVSSDIGEE